MKTLAYLDPGTGTLIVQAVLGGAAGAAVLWKTAGRRFRRKGEPEKIAQETGEGEAGEPTVPAAPAD